VSQQKLDLFEIAAVLAAQLCAGTPEVVAPKCSMPICLAEFSTTLQIDQSVKTSAHASITC
jgi:hypothetical protein